MHARGAPAAPCPSTPHAHPRRPCAWFSTLSEACRAGETGGALLAPFSPSFLSLSHLFFFSLSQADPPDAAKLPPGDVVGVTALLLTCSYQAKEFLRVGYYVNVEYLDEALREAPPERPVVEK